MTRVTCFRFLKLADVTLLTLIWILLSLLISKVVKSLGMIDRDRFWTGQSLKNNTWRRKVYVWVQTISALIVITILFRCFRRLIADLYKSPFPAHICGEETYDASRLRELYSVIVCSFVIFSTLPELKEKVVECYETLPFIPKWAAILIMLGILGLYLFAVGMAQNGR